MVKSSETADATLEAAKLEMIDLMIMTDTERWSPEGSQSLQVPDPRRRRIVSDLLSKLSMACLSNKCCLMPDE